MRLNSKAMEKIKYLERKYGQLSNTPSNHPYLKELSYYGKQKKRKMYDTKITFYLSEEEHEKINRITNSKVITRAPEVRKWIVGFLESPFNIDTKMKVEKDRMITFMIYSDDYKKLKHYSNKYSLSTEKLLSIIVKTKLNSMK